MSEQKVYGTPETVIAAMEGMPELERLRYVVGYYAGDSQWVEQTNDTIRWGWFTGHPRDIARAALGL